MRFFSLLVRFVPNRVEEEEEYLTNTLQQKLQKVLKEKIDLENQLEQETEYIVNRLQKQLEQLQKQKEEIEHRLEEETEQHQKKLDSLQLELHKLLAEQKQEGDRNLELRELLNKLKADNIHLKQQVERERDSVSDLKSN